jgi:hypothetical protein
MRYLAAVLLCASVPSFGASTFKGWISDSSCGAANADKAQASRDCARNCLKGGSKPVLVTLSDQKVLKLEGKFDALAHIDHPVEVVGELNGDTLKVAEIRKAK